MKMWQKFSVLFFVSAITTFFSPSVNAGGDLNGEESAQNDSINAPPVTFDENPDEQKIPAPNEKPAPPPEDTTNISNEISNENPVDTGVLGDINNDGELNAIDLVVLQKYLTGNIFEINKNAADINGDGNISKFDVFALLNLIKAEKKGTGDVNGDGKVDIYDVQSLTAYLANPSVNINIVNANLNGDGKIGTEDLKILKGVISALNQ